ncbi:hypothetical protein DVDV_2778 [Desulfovibrio sp. DV]|nr:hypothetical protein DVDV_2778 [Desulfovibrio sp. DV]
MPPAAGGLRPPDPPNGKSFSRGFLALVGNPVGLGPWQTKGLTGISVAVAVRGPCPRTATATAKPDQNAVHSP